MMQPVFGHDTLVADWVSQKTGDVYSPPYAAIGFTKDGKSLCAGVVFNNWNGSNVEISLASDGGITRDNIRTVYRYAFVQCGANRITAHTRRANRTMRELLPRLGFTKEAEGVLRKFYGPRRGDDAFVFGAFPETVRKWL
jgi:RimJ/RimL family protein N-acetyltransferase